MGSSQAQANRECTDGASSTSGAINEWHWSVLTFFVFFDSSVFGNSSSIWVFPIMNLGLQKLKRLITFPALRQSGCGYMALLYFVCVFYSKSLCESYVSKTLG